jgi:hypothetical protein
MIVFELGIPIGDIETLTHLLGHTPRRYEDFARGNRRALEGVSAFKRKHKKTKRHKGEPTCQLFQPRSHQTTSNAVLR